MADVKKLANHAALKIVAPGMQPRNNANDWDPFRLVAY